MVAPLLKGGPAAGTWLTTAWVKDLVVFDQVCPLVGVSYVNKVIKDSNIYVHHSFPGPW